MLALHREELICDLAEFYHIYDYRALPVSTLAVLVSGLRDNSRIRMKLAGLKAPPDIVLLAKIFDVANLLLWSRTEDAAKGRNAPEPISDAFIERESEYEGFASGEEFEAAREAILKRVKK